MYCRNCNTKLPGDAKFCPKCGAQINLEQAAPVQKEEKTESPSSSVNPAASSEPGAEKDTSSDEIDEWWAKCSKLKKALIISGIVVGCCLLLWLVILIIKKFAVLLIIGGIVLGCLVGSEESKAGMRKFVLKYSVILIIIAAGVIFLMAKPDFLPNLIQPGYNVRNAYLTQYSEEVTVGDAFDAYFDNGKWSTYKENGYSYVVFNGTNVYRGEEYDVRVTFLVTGEKFKLDSMDIDGESLDYISISLYLNKIFGAY